MPSQRNRRIAWRPGGALQVLNASEDTEARGDGRMKSGGRSVAGSNHAPVEIRRPLSAWPRLVRTKEQGTIERKFLAPAFFL